MTTLGGLDAINLGAFFTSLYSFDKTRFTKILIQIFIAKKLLLFSIIQENPVFSSLKNCIFLPVIQFPQKTRKQIRKTLQVFSNERSRSSLVGGLITVIEQVAKLFPPLTPFPVFGNLIFLNIRTSSPVNLRTNLSSALKLYKRH